MMKTPIIIMAAALMISLGVSGQATKDVPSSVTTAFSQKFPKATRVEWGKEGDREWEAEFKMNGKEYSANFDNSGAWMETEYEISAKEIPVAVKATLDKESAGYKIEVSEVSETKEGKTYEFIIENDKINIELAIDSNGKLLKKEAVEEETEDDEK